MQEVAVPEAYVPRSQPRGLEDLMAHEKPAGQDMQEDCPEEGW